MCKLGSLREERGYSAVARSAFCGSVASLLTSLYWGSHTLTVAIYGRIG